VSQRYYYFYYYYYYYYYCCNVRSRITGANAKDFTDAFKKLYLAPIILCRKLVDRFRIKCVVILLFDLNHYRQLSCRKSCNTEEKRKRLKMLCYFELVHFYTHLVCVLEQSAVCSARSVIYL